MTEPTFGLGIVREDNEPRLVLGADFSIIGLIGTAPAADAGAFPVNEPVELYSNDLTKLALLGATGTLVDGVRGINDQLGAYQQAARLVVVRVTHNASADTVIGAIVGDSTAGTGIHAFKRAASALGVTPRLIGAPGYTQQTKTGVLSIAVTGGGGSGYTTAPTVGFTGGGGSGAAATAQIADGKVTGYTITNPGSGYTSAPTVGLTGGGGTGAGGTASVGMLANPVVAALPGVLDSLLAHAVVDGPNTTAVEAKSWRETINSQRIIPVEGGAKVLNVDGVTVDTVPLSPRILGLAVRRDFETGGRPFHSWANQPVRGILAPARAIAFSLTDGATEAQDLLAHNIGVLVRGEAGVDTAIAEGGFIFIGTDNAGDDELWKFYNITRGRDYIHVALLRTLRSYLGRFNLTGQTVQAIINTVSFELRDRKADGDVLDYRVSFQAAQNSPEELRLGHLTIAFQAEEPPPITKITLRSARYRAAFDGLIEQLAAQAEQIAA